MGITGIQLTDHHGCLWQYQ